MTRCPITTTDTLPVRTTTTPDDAHAAGFDPARLAGLDAFFQHYVDDGRLPGWALRVSRRGQVAHDSRYGLRDVEAGLPVEPDTRFRIYSMTKPVTTVAAMMLYERGAFDLEDPIARWLPAFAEPRVYTGGPAAAPTTAPASRPIRVRHLMTHTAGLTYGFHRVHVTDEIYRRHGYEFGAPAGQTLAEVVDGFAQQPLAFEPGTEWLYSVATDVLGRLVEVWSGMPLDEFLRTEIFEPLGMTDTGFVVAESDAGRLAALYARAPSSGVTVRYDKLGHAAFRDDLFRSGGGGLVSTLDDYQRFADMLLAGGDLGGRRVLGPRTLRYMTRNHLPGGADLLSFGRPLHSESRDAGTGFGLGFSVIVDPVAHGVISSPGEFGWGGLASTTFWVDPVEELTVVFMTQLMPSSSFPIRPQLRQLVYGALVGR